VFPAPAPSYTADDFPGELIWVPKSLNPQTCSPEDCITCLFLPCSSARFLLIYLHSNADDLGRCHSFCSALREQFQVYILAVEYPGYGICAGGPCDEQKAIDAAFTAFRFVREVLQWPLDSIMILGRSIGTGPAISLANKHEVHGVIIVSPFLSVREVCRDTIGPLANLIDERFPNHERVANVRCPMLIVHGQEDSIIPLRHGQQLHDICPTRKLLVTPLKMSHNTNLFEDVAYFVLPMLQFFSLPDYCFEDISVPKWAFDKRLALGNNLLPSEVSSVVFPNKGDASDTKLDQNCFLMAKSCDAFGCLSSATRSFTPGSADASPEGNIADSERIVEETISAAIDQIFCRKDDMESVCGPLPEDDGTTLVVRSLASVSASGLHGSGVGYSCKHALRLDAERSPSGLGAHWRKMNRMAPQGLSPNKRLVLPLAHPASSPRGGEPPEDEPTSPNFDDPVNPDGAEGLQRPSFTRSFRCPVRNGITA